MHRVSGDRDHSWRIRTDGGSRRLLVSVVTEEQLRTLLATLFDEDAFLSPHGLRSLSKRLESPYTRARDARTR